VSVTPAQIKRGFVNTVMQAVRTSTPLAEAYDELVKDGYKFGAGHATFSAVTAALAHLRSGGTVSACLKDSDHKWAIDTPIKLEEFVYSQSRKTENLPQATREKIDIIRHVKKNGVRFHANAETNVPIVCKAAPLWLLGKGKLFARVNGGQPFQVDSLEALGKQYGRVPKPPKPPQVATAPAPPTTNPASAAPTTVVSSAAPPTTNQTAAGPVTTPPPPRQVPQGRPGVELDWTA